MTGMLDHVTESEVMLEWIITPKNESQQETRNAEEGGHDVTT